MNTTESKYHDYQLDLRSVNCYSSGKYKLKLEVKASDSQYDLSKVKVESTSESVDFEITEQTLQSQVLLSDGKLKYYFPKELLQEDVEVFISLQVTRYPQEQPSDERASPSYLTGKLVIHPRHQNKKPASLNEEPTSSSSPHKQPTSPNENPALVNEEPTSARDNPIPSKDESKLKDGVSGQLTNEPSHPRDEPSPSNIKPSSLKEGNDHLLSDEANSPSQELANLSTESTPSSVQDPAITSGTINLYVKLEDENIQQLGGKIWYEEKFNIMEEDEGKEDEEIETKMVEDKQDDEKIPQSEAKAGKDDEVEDRDKESKSISQSPKPAPVFPDKQAPTEKSMSEYVPSPESSRVGKLIALIHAAHLPTSPQTLQSRPFVKGFVRCFNGNVLTSESKHEETLPSQNASLSPLWEHQMCVSIDQDDVSKATLTLQLADFATSSTLSEFQIPISYLEPFHQYHLDLISSDNHKEDIHLFVSVVYQPSELPVLGELMYKALEVNILSLDMPVANPVGPLTATACLCSDYHANRNVLKNQDVRPTPVHFPSPHSSSFLVPTDVRSAFGHTQISTPARSETHPQWYHQFLFVNHRDLSSIFTDTSALIIYLSAAASAFDGRSWKLSQQIGVALQPLNKTVFDAMTDSRGKAGIKVHALKFQSTSLYGPNSKPLGINLTLRLIRGKNIESAISSSSPEFLPSLESFCHQDPAAEESKKQLNRTEDRLRNRLSPITSKTPLPVPLRQPQPSPAWNGYRRHRPKIDNASTNSSPPYNAMQNLLDRVVIADQKHGDELIPTRLPPESLQSARQPEEITDRFARSIMESQQRELDNYRQGLQRMAEEMVALQQSVSKLEAENSVLRRQLNMHEDAARALVTAENAEVLTKAELLDKFVTLKQALSQQVEESTNYRDKVLSLQNQLIKLNDKERTYIQQEKQMVAQTSLLKERNDKVKKLETTCRQQEMALEKMEKLLKRRLSKASLSPSDKPVADSPVVDALNVENYSLKAQLAQMKADSKPELTSTAAAEKLMKELQLEKAKKRILSLEREIVEKAREWGREKTSMQLNLDSDRDPGRYRTLPPLEQQYDFSYRNVDNYADRRYMSQRPPQRQPYSRTSPLF